MNVSSVESPIVRAQTFLDIRDDTMLKNFWMLWKFKKLGGNNEHSGLFLQKWRQLETWSDKEKFFSLLTEKIHWEIQKKKSSLIIIISKEMLLGLKTEILNNSGINT